jgi:hypothetical protein
MRAIDIYNYYLEWHDVFGFRERIAQEGNEMERNGARSLSGYGE